MTMLKQSGRAKWLGAVVLGLVLTACGSNQGSSPELTGVAQADARLAGTVTLTDSSPQPQQRAVATRPDGAFSVDAAGLVPPYTLKVQWYQSNGPKQLYAVSSGGAALDVNPFTDLAFSAAAGGRSAEQVFRSSDSDDRRRISDGATRLLARLQVVLAPLLERYGITDLGADRAAVRLLLEDIRIRRSDGVVTVTNRATGGVIFRGPLSDLDSGTFTAANMPEGPGTTPPPAGDGAALYEGSCAGCHGPLATSQVRGESANSIAEAIADDEGGMGTPALRALTSTQLSAIASALSGNGGGGGGGGTGGTDGAALYEGSCAGCHGPLATSQVRGESAGDIAEAIADNEGGMGTPALQALTSTQLSAIASALSGSGGGGGGGTPGTCTSFTYSAWGTCTAGTQTRTVLASMPAGCTGGAPVLSQACGTTPPPPDGAALYAQHCAGCHGNSKKGSSASSIQSAINGNVGGMGTAALRALTTAELQAIAAAP